jgi:DHA1 family quinolone resistance protein-like MFS transporter
MNKTLYVLWFSDVFILTGFGLITPIMAIFIKDNIIGGTILAAGIASALFLTTKAVVQIPFSRYVDSHEDKVKWLRIGTLLIITVPFQYLFAENIIAIYLAQITYGVGAGLAASAWLTLWSTNLDRYHEGFEWSLYSATVGLGTGLSAFLGGTLATYWGFNPTIMIMGALSAIGFLMLLRLENQTYNDTHHDMNDDIKKNIDYHKKRKLVQSHHR